MALSKDLTQKFNDLDPRDNPFTALYDTIVFSSNDWGAAQDFAWIYGIVIGWEHNDDDDEGPTALDELRVQYKWTDSQVERLRKLHKQFEEVRDFYESA